MARDQKSALEGDRELLLAFVETVVPAGGIDGGLPAASELPAFRDMSPEEARLVYGPVLDLVLADDRIQGWESFAALAPESRESIVRALHSDHPGLVAGAVGQTLLRYYGVDSVVQALGLEARTPHPQGYAVDDTDWALLDPVRKKDRIYRKATRPGDES